MTQNASADRTARLFSHAVVGLAAAGIVTLFMGRRQTPQAQIIGALVAIVLHEELDAPVAKELAALGL
jgi:hypothetical protein